jgi:hypothetical protein
MMRAQIAVRQVFIGLLDTLCQFTAFEQFQIRRLKHSVHRTLIPIHYIPILCRFQILCAYCNRDRIRV